MKRTKLTYYLLAALFFLQCNSAIIKTQPNSKIELGNKGTITFKMHTDRTYRNAFDAENYSQELFRVENLGVCSFAEINNFVYIAFTFEGECDFTGFYIAATEVPGPQEYLISFTWDALAGKADLFLNGVSFRKENPKYYKPFSVPGSGSHIVIPEGKISINDVKLSQEYIDKQKASELVPTSLRGKTFNMLGGESVDDSVNLIGVKNEILYSSDEKNNNSIEEWIVEGPAIIKYDKNEVVLSSEFPNPPNGSTGHFNVWCPEDFPEDIIIEWEFMPLTDYSACHLFFAAKGLEDQDLFDSALQERDGHYAQYIMGDIKNYYVIYYSNIIDMRASNLATSWLIKSKAPSALNFGKVGVKPGERKYHKMRLCKSGGHIQLSVDGNVCLDYIDEGSSRYGEILTSGKFGFRQMARMKAKYRNIKVWSIKESN